MTRTNPARHRGINLVESVVSVGAIVALATTVLIPALIGLRDRNRQAVCTARIGLLTRAMLVYAADYDETPPFMGRGWEDCDDLSSTEWPAGSGRTIRDWAYAEDWLMPDMPDYWLLEQVDWPHYAQVTNGTLYPYTRSEQLYRCPGFERAGIGSKSQQAFNYTRTWLGRTWYTAADPEGQAGSPYYTGNWCGCPGPIARLSQIHSPARLQMMLDERWDKHVAAPIEQFQQAGSGMLEDAISGGWMAADCMSFIFGNELGQYHGRRAHGIDAGACTEEVPRVRQASIGFYDGHVSLLADPLPDRNLPFPCIELIVAWLDVIIEQHHAQRGKLPVFYIAF